ncbi:MAG TPA: hypothetical protein VN366_07960, partial [Feifaniaceae bacterium]|nr:hypothetical protein [Feifaniaceae bacterium]
GYFLCRTNTILDGFAPPTGVQNAEQVATIQRRLGVEDDGIWGPKTESAYRSYMNAISRSPKPAKANPHQAVTALANAAKESGRTYGSAGYTADTFMKPAADAALAAASRAYGRTFGNPGFANSNKIDKNNLPKDPQAALSKIIDASSLGDKDKWRAKYTIDGMDTEVLQNLLQDVLRDGVAPYFSQAAWEKRAALMMSLGAQEDLAAIQDLQAASKSVGRTFGNPGFNASTFALRKIEPYFTAEKNSVRTPEQQAAMEALRGLYTYVSNSWRYSNEDLDKILYHIDNYAFNTQSNGSQLNQAEYAYEDPYHGSIKINSVETEGTDLMKFDANLFDRLSFALGASVPVTIPMLGSATALLELMELVDPDGYYKNHPNYLLRPNDVSISYNPSIGGTHSSKNYFRGGERLFSEYPSNGGAHNVYGQNFSQHAEKFNKEHPSGILDFLEAVASIIWNGPEIVTPIYPLEKLDPSSAPTYYT